MLYVLKCRARDLIRKFFQSMKKFMQYTAGFAAIASATVIPLAVSAKTPTYSLTPRSSHVGLRTGLHKAGTEMKKELMKSFAVHGSVTSASGTTLMVTEKNGTVYTVDASSAKLVDGLMVSDIQTGDTIYVMGTVNGTQVTARTIHDASFIGRNLFQGKITAINGSSLTVASSGKSSSTTYTVDASSAVITRMAWVKGSAPTSTTITLTDIAVGDHVTVVGTVSGSTVTAKAIKDQPKMKWTSSSIKPHKKTM